jgi:ribosome-associated toxin RatA of RatAB toxin-antitoxin module
VLFQVVAETGPLFHHLTNSWLFEPGPQLNTCWTSCQISYQFKSLLYQMIAENVFNEVQRTMISAFERRCEEIYGQNMHKSRKS